MTTLTRSQAAKILSNLEWRVDTSSRLTQAIKDFQLGWNLGPWLTIDGIVGPNTSAALLKSEARRRAGYGTASAHFSFKEFACKCDGRYASCRRIWINRNQVHRLETLRTKWGRAISVVSGCRCYYHNKAVGGATNSQHLYGTATDLDGPDKDWVRSQHIFAGIGYGGVTDRAKHVDSRDRSGHNATGGSTTYPTIWKYATW
jgi:hypothetical protein